jgi:hypothetical protein
VPVRYVVSGGNEFTDAVERLKNSGRQLRHDLEVADQAADEIPPLDRVVMVAHGDAAGTVYLSKTGIGERRWLWVGMGQAPTDARIYLYACYAGRKLPTYLTACEVFGHTSKVPIPDGDGSGVVLLYLEQVDRLMNEEKFDRESWRKELGRFVNEQIVMGDENGTWLDGSFLSPIYLHLLRQSLGNPE